MKAVISALCLYSLHGCQLQLSPSAPLHLDSSLLRWLLDFPGGSVIKNLPPSAVHKRDVGSISGSGRSPGGGNGNPLQYSCLENPINREIFPATLINKNESSQNCDPANATNPPWWLLRSFVVSLLSCVQLCDPMDCSAPGFPFPQHLPEFAQTHVHWVGDAIQPSHLLSSPSLPAFNLSQHQGLFQWVGSLHLVAKVLELQYQSFQWIFRVDFL